MLDFFVAQEPDLLCLNVMLSNTAIGYGPHNLESYSTARGPRNFEPWSSDNTNVRASNLGSSARRVFKETRIRTNDLVSCASVLSSRPWPLLPKRYIRSVEWKTQWLSGRASRAFTLQTDHLTGTSVHAPQRSMVTRIEMGIVGLDLYGLLRP
ncbi:hypothetical protein TNCV_145661 [Trichonephila clavipes]|nr:hypothetical protein TNCV_145661 [Trichonephila clavipes]